MGRGSRPPPSFRIGRVSFSIRSGSLSNLPFRTVEGMVQDRRFSTSSIDRFAMAHAFASIVRALFLLSVSWIASSPLVRAGDPGEAVPGVLDLLPTTFDGHLDGAKHALVEFYAPYVAKRGTWDQLLSLLAPGNHAC